MENFTVKLHCTHSHIGTRLAEIRFDRTQTVYQAKELLERKFGTSVDCMNLELRDTSLNTVCMMSDNAKTLSDYGVQEYYTIHVFDTSGTAASVNEWDDVSKVEKYKISDKDYNKRDDTFRKFKENMIKNNPNFCNAQGESAYEDFQKAEAEAITVGQRCQVHIGDRRGVVAYVGRIKGMGAGYWLGILLDEPTGDSDGKVAGKKIFEVPCKNMGLFVRPNELDIGDFPPIDDFDADLDEI